MNRRRAHRQAVAAAVVAAALGSTGAAAAPRATLEQLGRSAGCHASVPGFLGVPMTCRRSPIKYVGPLALSPEGRHVYSANGHGSAATGSLTMFARDRRSGALRVLGGGPGCVANEKRVQSLRGCRIARVGKPEALTVSRDGKYVYAAAGGPDIEVAVLTRDAATGRLSQAAGAAGCVGRPAAGCAPGYGLKSVNYLELSPDGAYLYVVAESRALAVYARDPATGALSARAGGCLHGGDPDEQDRPAACVRVAVIPQPGDLALSPDGRNVYVADAERGHVAVFNRDRSTGSLSAAGAARGHRGDDLYAVTISPDGRSLYAAGLLETHVFRRDLTGGSLTLLDNAIHGARGTEFFDFTVAPDGRSVYTAGGLDGLAVFSRARDGRLRQLPGRHGCLSHTGGRYHWDTPGRECTLVRSLIQGLHTLVAPDGRHAYVSGTYVTGTSVQSAISIFRRIRS